MNIQWVISNIINNEIDTSKQIWYYVRVFTVDDWISQTWLQFKIIIAF